MKRRVLSLILMLALCLNLCPVWVLAAEEDTSSGLCPHHPEHTDVCGYAPPTPEQECTHTHDESCFITATDCIHTHTAECYPDGSDPETDAPDACTHECSEENGCVTQTLACAHEHDETCGYVPASPGAPCAFVCPICPVDALIAALPRSISAYNIEQVQDQLLEIYDLYDALSADEQQQVDLSPCAALQDQIDEMDVAPLSSSPNPSLNLSSNTSYNNPYEISVSGAVIKTNEYTFIGTGTSAIWVTGTGALTLSGTVSAKNIGIRVESGGSLTITDPNTSVTGGVASYALSIASGAKVTLYGGTYSGSKGAILLDSGSYADLLASGCAYFDENGNPLSLSAVASAKTVTVGQCTEHSGKTFQHTSGTTKHTWTCPYCGTKETEMCTFEFDDNGAGTCADCGNSISIVVDEDDLTNLVYDGTTKPDDVEITVTITDGSSTVLTKDTDYEVEYEPRKDAGEIKVTVTGITFNGTFIKTYTVAQDQPGIRWDSTTWDVDYDSRGIPVDSAKLPPINITLTTSNDEDLHQYLQYSYRKDGDAEFIDGLPTNAGDYEVKAYLPESQNYKAAETNPCLELTINKIPALITPPKPTLPTYDKTSHELVTAGEVQNGAVIEYAQSAGGPYSADIPTGINAGDYTVWYRIADTENYNGVSETQVPGVKILRKEITPYVTLSQYSFLYTGEKHQPTVTVVDRGDYTVLSVVEYEVTYDNNQNVTTETDPATVTVSDRAGGNYQILPVTVDFEITAQTQNSLSIAGKPNTVTYGDQFTLSTVGGSADGKVTWEIIDVDDVQVATIDPDGGQVTVIGHGSATVKATRVEENGNYINATADWTFTAYKKPVVATVTAEDKEYDGTNDATVHAVVESGVRAGDEIEITGLMGTFSDANVGVDKTVTVDADSAANATISGKNHEHYDVSYSSLTVKATISKKVVGITTAPVAATLIYNGTAQELLASGAVVDTTGVVSGTTVDVEYALSEDGPYSTDLPKATDAGDYTVWYRVKETDDYIGKAPASVTVTIDKKSVAATVTVNTDPVTYDGTAQTPAVTVTGGGDTIPDSNYTVTYSNNINAGNATVTVTAKDDGNYIFDNSPVTANFTIGPKHITAKIELSETSYKYDGTKKNPKVTVKDGQTVLDEDQYSVTWEDDNNPASTDVLTAAGTYTATIENAANGNYVFTATAKVEIVTADQDALKITGKPDHVYYGDRITTLDTVGGTIDGTVTWKLSGGTNSTIDAATGVLTIKDTDPLTVTAERVVPNYGTVSDTWSVTVEPKPVVAVVTIAAKAYDGTTTIAPTAISAAVKSSDLVDNDSITITGLEGAYEDANAGTNKTVTLDNTGATVTGDIDKYAVSFPATANADINPRAVDVTVTLSDHDLKPDDDGNFYYEYDGNEKKPNVTVKGTDTGGYDATLASSDYTVAYSDNKNAGNATVTVTNAAGGNYKFDAANVTFKIKASGAQLTGTPQAKDLTYTGADQELVTVGTATGGHLEYSLNGTNYSSDIPKETNAGTYTVYYMVVGDGNHGDTAPGQVSVTIKPKEIVSPVVTVDGSFTYDGTEQKPSATDIKVEDGGTTIPTDEYTVSYRDNINAGTATVVITNANGGNYIVNGTGSFTIAKAEIAAADVTKPSGLNLPYNGTAQALVKVGEASGGTMVYSLSATGDYSPSIPTQTAVGNYTVWYKVQGDDNHKDTDSDSVTASIVKNTVNKPTIQVVPESVTYNSKKQEPTVTVLDDKGLLIDSSEYTVTYATDDGNDDLINAGEYTLVIANKGTNYSLSATAKFTILAADQTPLTIEGKRERVYYGDTIQLSASGGNGAVTWTVDDGTVATISDTGLLEITGVGSVTITATSTAVGYNVQTAKWPFYADKKPVTAVVTAASRPYDKDNVSATVTATLQSSDLVGGDVIKITLSGTFDDANAGTNKKVTVNASTPNFDDCTGNFANYNITYPATTTASILKANIESTAITAPTAETGLAYTGKPLALVSGGGSSDGTMEYSTDNVTYSASLPTGTDAGDYDVWYRVKGDSNHNDTAAEKLGQVTIAKQKVTNPIIEFTPNSVSYDGAVHKPEVKVKDNNGREIPDTEYTVTYDPNTDWKTAKKHTVTITANEGGNYTFNAATKDFEILRMGQNPLTILNQPGRVQYGDTFTLVMSGGSGTGAMTWESSDPYTASINASSGLVTVHKSGLVTITAKKAADDNYSAQTVTWTFSAEKKPVTAIVTAQNKVYDTYETATLVVTWPAGALINNDSIDLASALTGKFDDPSVGTNKTVLITGTPPDEANYDVTWNTTTTASITPAAATVTGPTTSALTYNGKPQALISGVTATHGTVVYSRNGATFTLAVPEETNAGTYTFWYKALADENYKDSAVVAATVTIAPKTVTADNLVITLTPETFEYDGTPKRPDVEVKDGNTVIPASEYSVSYSNNTAVGTGTVTITDADGGNYQIATKSAPFTIAGGAANLTGAPQAKSLTYNGNEQELVTDGTAVNGQVVYSLTDTDDYTSTIPTGINAGTYSVYYKVKGANGVLDTAARIVYVTIQPKSVQPNITVVGNPVTYDGNAQTPELLVFVENQKLTSGKDYNTYYSNNTRPGTATVIVWSVDGTNYQFSTQVTFEIVKEAAEFTTRPDAIAGLTYNGKAQKLVTPGDSDDGIVYYTMDGVTYSYTIPTATAVGEYTILAKVVGDKTHEDSDPIQITAEITVNTIAATDLTVEWPDGDSFDYTGKAITPTVIVKDKDGNIIPASEYTVRYENNINAGSAAEIHITSTGDNYNFSTTETFTIVGPGQPALVITGKPDTVCYGDTFQLKAEGGSGTGTVTWTSSDDNVATIDSTGTVTAKKSGSVTIKAEKGGSEGTLTFYISPKPVKADVFAKDKTYDNSTTATLTVVFSGLVPSESISDAGYEVTGTFTNENVGNNIPVIISLTVKDSSISEKYDIDYNHTTTASITQATASVTGVTAAGTLTYNGSPQALVDSSGATVKGGYLAYSLNGTDYTPSIPTGTDAGTYNVWYKVVANDGNYKDSAPVPLDSVTIAPNTNPVTVQCTPNKIAYDGTAKTPTVVVLDNANRPIPESEYSVSITGGPAINVGKYNITVKDNVGGNYDFTTVNASNAFEIVAASQPLLSITGAPSDVHYGDMFILRAEGGSGSGTIQWSVTGSAASVDTNGLVTVTGTGGFTVEAYREGDDNYGDSSKVSLPFYADPKPVTPVVLAKDKVYDGGTTATLTASLRSSDLVNGDTGDTITLTVEGHFMTADAGTSKQVVIEPKTPSTLYPNYLINWPASTTASITRAQAELSTKPAANPNLTYDASAQDLLTGGTTKDSIGTVEYSRDQYGEYSTDIPTGTNADTYVVWYRVEDNVNYMGIGATSITVVIKKATPTYTVPTANAGTVGQTLEKIGFSDGGSASVDGKFTWENGNIEPGLGTTQQNVIFTPTDTANYETVTFSIPVTVTSASGSGDSSGGSDSSSSSGGSSGGSGTNSASTASTVSTATQTTVRNGTASTVLSAAEGSKLVQEAAANQSQNIVIQPEISQAVTKSEVSIPAETVREMTTRTSAALTVSAPMADVTISPAALQALSGTGSSVSVAAEQVDQAVVLTLTAGGETVENLPGGLTLTVPAEDATPGTVAVLVHDDGTRETIRKSVVEDGQLSIPLSGSATVEIVDNSKTFSDVPDTSWAADAVAFASAHELFSGTSETTFSPDQAMSRGMLVTVLYSLEGSPETALASDFGDVSGEAWYADSVAWATENGIASGYGDGQFGPNDSITREQFVVMLWKYAGSPASSTQALDFTDADQASGYALEALRWATEKGILNGYSDGQLLPGGTATRAQAAQMLKNFLENS